jgi:hypothetical protein
LVGTLAVKTKSEEVLMDERFRGKGLWIGLGAMAVVFLCIMLCGMGAMFAVPRSQVYVQPPPAGEGAAAQAPPAYYGYGAPDIGRHGVGGPLGFLFGAIGALFRLAFLGLLLLLGLGLVKRIFWAHRCWGPPPGWKPPQGEEGGGTPYAARGPWGWHRHHRYWGPPPWWAAPSQPEAAADERAAERDDEPGEQYRVEE